MTPAKGPYDNLHPRQGSVVPLLQTIRGMCSDEEPYPAIDTKLVEAINVIDWAVDDRETLREAILHVLRYGDVGKRSQGRLRAAINATYRKSYEPDA